MLIIYFPYVHTIRTDIFTNLDWEKITKSKLIQTRTLTDQEHHSQEEEPRTQGLDPLSRLRFRPCFNSLASVTLDSDSSLFPHLTHQRHLTY